MRHRRPLAIRRSIAPALGAIVCAFVLAACGSSNSSNNASSSSGQSAGIRFADCMRSHGVPNFPDPGGGGGGFQIPAGSGVDPASPAFQSAQKDCQKLLPFGGPGRGQSSEARKLQLLKLAECMRSHGIASFPDPSNSPPSAPPAGGGIAFGGPGGFISVPQTLINSPGFKQAGQACGFPGLRGGGPKASAL
jgi:hypothetical protein